MGLNEIYTVQRATV